MSAEPVKSTARTAITSTTRGVDLRSRALSTSTLELPHWLELSWFYPDGFVREKLVETPYSWLVLGNSFVYKFFKGAAPLGSGEESEDRSLSTRKAFRLRWQKACDELLNNSDLAEDCYVGLRLLQWQNGIPTWMSIKPGRDIDPDRPPTHADDVAVIMRRLPSRGYLHHRTHEGTLTPRMLRAVTDRLAQFHRKTAFPLGSDSRRISLKLFDQVRSTYLQHCARAVPKDAVSQLLAVILSELSTFLRREFEQLRDEFVRRGKQGFLVDSHGRLTAGRVCIEREETGRRRITMQGRTPLRHPLRASDIVSDLASLSASLEALGAADVAETIELEYFSRIPEAFDPRVFRLFKVAETIRLAARLTHANGPESDPSTTREDALGALMRAHMKAWNLSGALLVLVDSSGESGRRIISSLQSTADFDCVPISDELRRTHGRPETTIERFFSIERRTRHILDALDRGRSVIVDTATFGLNELRLCEDIAERAKARFAAVHAKGSSEHVDRSFSLHSEPLSSHIHVLEECSDPTSIASEILRTPRQRWTR